jgi:sugar lactone lactonase YvrE
VIEKLVDPNVQAEKIAGGFKFTEGPVFSRRGFLLFSDIPNAKIMHWEGGKLTTFRENSNGANGLTFDHQGRLLACEKGRVTRTEKDGKITVMAEGMNGPNDLVYAIDGSIYFTDLPAGTVYQITRKGEVRPAAKDCPRPNGVALAPNQQKLYVADVGESNLWVWDVNGDGSLKNGRIFCAGLRADGIKTSESGHVWAATKGAIAVVDPGGKQIGQVPVPESPSNLCWGAGFRGLFITARTSVYRIPTRASGTRTF